MTARIDPRWLLVIAALALGLGCAARPLSPPPPDPDPLDREDYVIGVTDVLHIKVWKNPELDAAVPVRPDGKISVPLLDDVQAEGLTPMELKEILTREFSEFVESPDVTVIVNQMNSRSISVLGGAARNARLPLSKNMRVLEALAAVGGFKTFSDTSDIRIVRQNEDGTESEYRFDYDAYIEGRAPGTNIVLRDGDIIIVPE